MNIKITKAVPDDAERLLEYLKTVGGESDNLLFGAAGLPISVEDERKIIGGIMKSDKDCMLVARDDDTIIGVGQFSCNTSPRISHQGRIAMSVLKRCWGQGVGSAIMRELIDFAKNTAHAEIISLEVRSDNKRAIALYQKFGFERFGTYKRFFLIDGNYYDADYMNLYLKQVD